MDPDLDLGEVLAKSQATFARLEAHSSKSGADRIPRLERALPQIDRESRRLTVPLVPAADANSGAGLDKLPLGAERRVRTRAEQTSEDAAAGVRLLSQHGVDTERIRRGLAQPHLLTPVDASGVVQETDLDAILASDHESAVVTAVSTALKRTQAASMERVAAALDAEWENAKRELVALPKLEPRKVRPAPQASPSTAPGGVLASPFRKLHDAGTLAATEATPRKAGVDRLRFSARSTDIERPGLSTSSMFRKSVPGDSQFYLHRQQHARPRRALTQPHSLYDAIVRRVVHGRSNPTNTIAVATEIDNALVAEHAPGGDILAASRPIRDLHAVFTALRYITGEASSTGTLPPSEGTYGGMNSPKDRRDATLSVIRYLALQFREEKMRREVEARPAEARRGGVPGLIGDMRAYLNLLFKNSIPVQLATGPCVAGLPLWPQVYFCLRGGDANAALGVLDEVLRTGGTTSRSVSLYRDCLTRYVESGDRRALPEDMLADLVHDYATSVYHGQDTFQRVCYVVIARLDPATPGEKMSLWDDDYGLLFQSIEDYLWLRLSVARLDGDADPPGALASHSLKLEGVQREVLAFGAPHFDKHGDTPVFYALVLILCGEYARAIEYLEKDARAITEAMHIAFVLYYYGMLRDGDGEAGEAAEQDAGASVGAGAGVSQRGGDKAPPRSPYAVDYAGLVWRYVSMAFGNDDPATAAVYLFTIRHTRTRNRLLEDLVLTTRAFGQLLGDGPQTVPGRTRGVLEELWPLGGRDAALEGNNWQSLVSSAASTAMRKGDRDTAAQLHDLAGDTLMVLHILADRLSAELTARGSPARADALTRAQHYQQVLASRGIPLTISDDASLGLVSSNAIMRSVPALIALAAFYDDLWREDFENAWGRISSIGILPLTTDEIPRRLRDAEPAAARWAESVCDRIPGAVVAAAQGLAQMYSSEPRDTVRACISVLVQFGGRLPTMPPDMSAQLIRLDILM